MGCHFSLDVYFENAQLVAVLAAARALAQLEKDGGPLVLRKADGTGTITVGDDGAEFPAARHFRGTYQQAWTLGLWFVEDETILDILARRLYFDRSPGAYRQLMAPDLARHLDDCDAREESADGIARLRRSLATRDVELGPFLLRYSREREGRTEFLLQGLELVVEVGACLFNLSVRAVWSSHNELIYGSPTFTSWATDLLAELGGVCAMRNYEDAATIFWYRGQTVEHAVQEYVDFANIDQAAWERALMAWPPRIDPWEHARRRRALEEEQRLIRDVFLKRTRPRLALVPPPGD